MTLSTTTSRVTYPGTGSLGPFAFNFRIFAADDLLLTVRSSNGGETALTYIDDYSISGLGNSAGRVTLVTPLEAGEALTIRRVMHLQQDTSIRNQGADFPSTIEDQFDRLVMIDQQHEDALRRSLRLSETFDPSSYDMVLRDVTAGKVVTGTGTGLTMSALDSQAVALPGQGRTVTTLSAYLANNALFNVKDYGAVGNGTANDTAAIQAALVAADRTVAAKQHTIGGITSILSGFYPTVVLPAGRYLITNTLNCGAYVRVITLEGAEIVQTDTRKDIFSAPDGFRCSFEGLHFFGGRHHIYYRNNNIDTAHLNIRDCDFNISSSRAIQVGDTLGGGSTESTMVLAMNCNFYKCRQAVESRADSFFLFNCWNWVGADAVTADTAQFVNRGFEMKFERMFGVPPASATPNNLRWVDNYTRFYAHDCRFGAEGGGIGGVYQRGAPNTNADGTCISITNSYIAAGSDRYAGAGLVHLKEHVPNQIILRGNRGLTLTPIIAKGGALNLDTYFDGYSNPAELFRFDIDPTNLILSPDAIPAQLKGFLSPLSYNASASLPTSGWYETGQYIRKTTPVVAGGAGNQYVIKGWTRLTRGERHVLNADWVEDRALTGT